VGKSHNESHHLYTNVVGSSNDMHASSAVANFIFGGTNNHIAHHLFPNYHHIYYPKNSRIVYGILEKHHIHPNHTTYRGGVVSHRMAAKTYDLNQYVMDKFLGLPLQILEKKGYQGTDSAEYATEYFIYTRELEGLSDFADWLEKLLQSEAFLVFREKYDQTRLDLDKETNTETRRYLLKFIRQLSDEF